jgi:tRNA pseudouridine55 synthase
MNGWLNLYKPSGISSAKAVAIAKKHFKGSKIGHTGTLDLEAEGVLPLAIGQATKLVSILMDSKKQYEFTIQFGAKTTTADRAGEIIQTTSHFPNEYECREICSKFIGIIEQTPPAYSALKIDGVRAYKLARENKEFKIKKRHITIYALDLLKFDGVNNRASYRADCSKGTYIRTLAEDISLSLQSLGFVIELRRTKVGIFNEENSVNISDFGEDTSEFIRSKCLKIEAVLDDIPVLEVDELTAKKIRFGQVCVIARNNVTKQSQEAEVMLPEMAASPEAPRHDESMDLIWLKYEDKILAIGNLHDGYFKSLRVFNYIENGE